MITQGQGILEEEEIEIRVKNSITLPDFVKNNTGNIEITQKVGTVFNLSNTSLSMEEILVLQLGPGFIPTPSNKIREEELLVLEGLRFLDHLGTADSPW